MKRWANKKSELKVSTVVGVKRVLRKLYKNLKKEMKQYIEIS